MGLPFDPGRAIVSVLRPCGRALRNQYAVAQRLLHGWNKFVCICDHINVPGMHWHVSRGVPILPAARPRLLVDLYICLVVSFYGTKLNASDQRTLHSPPPSEQVHQHGRTEHRTKKSVHNKEPQFENSSNRVTLCCVLNACLDVLVNRLGRSLEVLDGVWCQNGIEWRPGEGIQPQGLEALSGPLPGQSELEDAQAGPIQGGVRKIDKNSTMDRAEETHGLVCN